MFVMYRLLIMAVCSDKETTPLSVQCNNISVKSTNNRRITPSQSGGQLLYLNILYIQQQTAEAAYSACFACSISFLNWLSLIVPVTQNIVTVPQATLSCSLQMIGAALKMRMFAIQTDPRALETAGLPITGRHIKYKYSCRKLYVGFQFF